MSQDQPVTPDPVSPPPTGDGDSAEALVDQMEDRVLGGGANPLEQDAPEIDDGPTHGSADEAATTVDGPAHVEAPD